MKPYKKTATVQVQNLAQSIRAITKRDDVFTEQVRDYALAHGIKIHQGAGYIFVIGEDAERIRAAFIRGEDKSKRKYLIDLCLGNIPRERLQEAKKILLPWDEHGLLEQLRVIREELAKFGWKITITQ